MSRGIAEKEIKETIQDGREVATEEVGMKGGFISKFYKTFTDRSDPKNPKIKFVVAVCETFEDRYILLSCYLETIRR